MVPAVSASSTSKWSGFHVESCEDVDTDRWGDLIGSCAEKGFPVECRSCRGAPPSFVRAAGTCTQETTQCHYREMNETCAGALECKEP